MTPAEAQLADAIAECYADPLKFVLLAYPWGVKGTSLEKFPTGPDKWQRQFLKDIGEQVKQRRFDGRNAVDPIRMGTSSGHGIGKSSITAWIVDWIMSTRPHCVGTITANTFQQLQTKTWASIQKWTGLLINSHWFRVTGEKMSHVQHSATWFCSAQTCREENSEAFAGQHAASSTSFYIFDEASAVPDKIYEVAEGGITDGEPMMFLFGNPTRSTGKFYRAAFGSERNRWNVRTIDSRESAFTNKKQIDEWISDLGEDSDFVRVRVRGLPPRASDLQFIDSDRVFDSQRRVPFHAADDPLIVGVDVARGGGDRSVIRFRRGLDAASIPPIVIPGEETRDTMRLVTILLDVMSKTYDGVKPSMAFVDGTGIGGPIVDRCQQFGHRNVVEVQFGWKSPDNHYANMRVYMWWRMKEWLMRGSIDRNPQLEIDLTSPGYGHDKSDRIWLETKEAMKKRGVDSPDHGDALALTFAQPVALISEPVEENLYTMNESYGLNWMA
jgi:hypothetical protein